MKSIYGYNGILTRQRLNDIAKEVFRKSIHMCSSLIPLVLRYYYVQALVALSIVTVVYVFAELIRLKGKSVPFFSVITIAAARKRDENKFVLGPVTLSLGIIITALLYPLLPATVGIYALAFGDGLASLSGKLFGKVYIPFTSGKTVAGSLTCFTAIFLSSYIATKNASIALILASCGMFIEVLPLKDFDNVIIPISIGFLANILLSVFGVQ